MERKGKVRLLHDMRLYQKTRQDYSRSRLVPILVSYSYRNTGTSLMTVPSAFPDIVIIDLILCSTMSTVEEGFEPSKLSANHLAFLIDSIRDWQFEHGSLLKFPPKSGKIIARPIGVSVFPSNFSKSCFEEARDIQIFFNSLYAAISCDEAWLHQALQSLIESDSMAKILWEIHCAVKVEGYVQCMSLGVFRSDYMLHMESKNAEPILKQVEFNTYSVAGGAHSNKISEMHKYGSGTIPIAARMN